MLVGYNTNISFKDKTYHVQTEDNGRSNPVIVTLLYSQGAILASKKTNYAHLINDPDLNEKLRKLMKIQHKGIIKELLAGKYSREPAEQEKTEEARVTDAQQQEEIVDARIEEPASRLPQKETIAAQVEEPEAVAPQAQTAEHSDAKDGTKDHITKSLDDILLNYILKRGK